MRSLQPYIKSLLEAVEQYHARPIRTTVDFEALRHLPAPMLASNYSELSFVEQQAEDEHYQKAVQEHKKSTIKLWAEAYRARHNLAPLTAELLEYFD